MDLGVESFRSARSQVAMHPVVPSRVQTTRPSGGIACDGARLRPRCDLRLLPDP